MSERRAKNRTSVGVFAVDPGGTTGVAWGVFDWKGSVGATLAGGRLLGSAQVDSAEGGGGGRGEMLAADEILSRYESFCSLCRRAGGVSRVVLVVEDFVLRPQVATKGREMLSPVRITALMEGWWWGRHGELLQYELQGPAEAKGFATNERLKRWGVETHGGGRHAKDAWRHIGVYLAKLTTTKGKKR